jgi:hypothetical protein
LLKKYTDDETFLLNMEKLLALASVAVGDITRAFELVAVDLEDQADFFLDHFERTWVKEPKRRGDEVIS